jgi:hypothetical protein
MLGFVHMALAITSSMQQQTFHATAVGRDASSIAESVK